LSVARLLASLALAFAAGMVPMTTALACDCEFVEPEAQLARAEVAFVGTVTQVGWEFEGPPPPDLPGAAQPVTFAVEEAIKGAPGSTIRIFSSLDSGMCGIAFAVKQRWQLYAIGGAGGQLTTNNCQGSVLLGEGVIPTPAEEPIRVPTELLVAGAGVALLALVSALAFRRRDA
jgi:hypothetical protein